MYLRWATITQGFRWKNAVFRHHKNSSKTAFFQAMVWCLILSTGQFIKFFPGFYLIAIKINQRLTVVCYDCFFLLSNKENFLLKYKQTKYLLWRSSAAKKLVCGMLSSLISSGIFSFYYSEYGLLNCLSGDLKQPRHVHYWSSWETNWHSTFSGFRLRKKDSKRSQSL